MNPWPDQHLNPQLVTCLSQQMDEAWVEAFIKNGLPLKLIDDELFRKAVRLTAQCGSQAVTHSKSGRYDCTLPHRTSLSSKLVPATDARLDKENMLRMKGSIQKLGCTIMSDGWQSTSNRPIINVILGTNGMLTLRSATDTSGQEKTMDYLISLVDKVIQEVGCHNVFAVCMDGACRGALDLTRLKYPWIQPFVCPSHGIDGFLKNACSDKNDIRMQANLMGGVGMSDVPWDEDFFKSTFDKAWSVISTVTRHQKTIAIFRDIAKSLPSDQKPNVLHLLASIAGQLRGGFTVRDAICWGRAWLRSLCEDTLI